MIATDSIRAPELRKYDRLWRDVDTYREVSPGSGLVGVCLGMVPLSPGCRVVDVGCGTGRAGLTFSQLLMRTTLVDGSLMAVDTAVLDEGLPFVEACLWDDWPSRLPRQDLAFCSDVLEHIPIEFTMLVIARCLQAAPLAFFNICNQHDLHGRLINETLHLTVQPYVWWRDRLAELGDLVDARDLCGSSLFLLRRKA